MRISVDLDGCLVRWVPAAVEAVNSLWPNKLPADFEPTAWDWSPDITAEELKAASDKMHATPDFWYNLKPYTENVSALRSFLHRRPNTEVYYLTARWSSEENSALEQSTAWLRRQRLMSPRTSVVRVARADEKLLVLEALHVDAFIDDRLRTIADCHISSKWFGFAYLLSRPWNTGLEEDIRGEVGEDEARYIGRHHVVDSMEQFLERAKADTALTVKVATNA